MHKKLVMVAAVLLLNGAAVVMAGGFVESGARFDLVTTNYDPEVKGQEGIFPLAVGYSRGDKLTLGVSTAYAVAQYDYPFDAEDPRRTPEKLTDVEVQATSSFRWHGLGHLALLGVGLPSGDPTWEAKRLAADVPTEYVSSDSFGAGLSTTAIYGLSAGKDSLEVSLAGGYIYNGEYDPTDNGEVNELKLGDIITALVGGRYKLRAKLSLETRLSYAHSFVTKSEGQQVFRQGDLFKLVGGVGYDWREKLRLRLGLQGDIFAKNENISDEENPVLQEQYRNGNRVGITADMDYQRGEKLLLTAEGLYRYVAANDGKDDYLDKGGYALGCGLDGTYALLKPLDVQAGVAYQYVTDKDEAFDKDGNPTAVLYHRLSTRLGVKYFF